MLYAVYVKVKVELRNTGNTLRAYTPALLTSAWLPLTAASSLSTIVLPSCLLFRVGLDSGLGISRVFDRLGRKGMGVVGLDDRNYALLAKVPLSRMSRETY
jgi:hypothetical protein